MATVKPTSFELHDDQPVIEIEKDIRALSTEAFANEIVTVVVHSTTDENQPPSIILNVNGTNMPLARGVPTDVKRKYVEVLARMKETRYSQPQRDMGNPEHGNAVIGRSALVYPFDVIEDKNPMGRTWLNQILAEPA